MAAPGLTDDDCRVAFDRSALYDRYRGVRRVGTGVGLALVAGLATRLGGRAIRRPFAGGRSLLHDLAAAAALALTLDDRGVGSRRRPGRYPGSVPSVLS